MISLKLMAYIPVAVKGNFPKDFEPMFSGIDETAKGCLTIFWELSTMIPCASKNLKR